MAGKEKQLINGESMQAEEALKKLIEGNKRYANGCMEHGHQDAGRIENLLSGQEPFAIVLTCSDSRVVPEIIFDQGLGDIFVIRVAGNIVDDAVLGSVEYAAEHLGVRLVVVLGHTCCGAVTAALQDDKPAGHVSIITDAIKPAVEKAKKLAGDLLENAIKVNTVLAAEQIEQSPEILDGLVTGEGLKVVPAIYDLGSGNVQTIER